MSTHGTAYSVDIDFLDRAIGIQRSAVRFHTGFALGIVGLGLAFILLLPLLPVLPEDARGLFTIGGGFVSTLSSFPIKELFTRRQNVEGLTYLRRQYEQLKSGALASGDAEWVQKQVRDLIGRQLGA